MPSSAMSSGLKPTDIIGSDIVHGVWPDDGSIEAMDHLVDTYRTESAKRSLGADTVEQARMVIRHSMVGNDFEPMHEKLAQLSHDQQLLTEDAASIAIKMIAQIARAQNASVVVEGIETEGQALKMTKLGCGYAQGFLFGRPSDDQTRYCSPALALRSA